MYETNAFQHTCAYVCINRFIRYDDFTQTEDSEVMQLLGAAKQELPPAMPAGKEPADAGKTAAAAGQAAAAGGVPPGPTEPDSIGRWQRGRAVEKEVDIALGPGPGVSVVQVSVTAGDCETPAAVAACLHDQRCAQRLFLKLRVVQVLR